MTTLTPAQHEVARLWACGLSCAAIAARRGTCRSTSTTLLASAQRALGVSDRRALAARLQQGVSLRSSKPPGRPARTSRFGFEPGERVRLVGGLYAGRDAVYRAAHSARQIKVQVGCGIVAVLVENVEAMR